MAIRQLKSKRTRIYLGLLCAVFVFVIEIARLPLLRFVMRQLDSRIYDQIVQFSRVTPPTEPKVIIIDIDDKSVQEEGQWPWARDKIALLVNKLKQAGVVTIGIDLVMSNAEENSALGLKKILLPMMATFTSKQQQLPQLLTEIAPKVDNDLLFAHSLVDHNVVFGFLFHNDPKVRKGELPPPLTYPDGSIIYRNHLPIHQFTGYNGVLKLFLEAGEQAGSISILPDEDGYVRHNLLLPSYTNLLYPSLPLAVAMNYFHVEHLTLKTFRGHLQGVQMGPIYIPTTEYGQIVVPFWGPPRTLPYYSATDLMHDRIDPQNLRGGIAVIGSTMILLGDLHLSSIGALFPGVEMMGNMIKGIISQKLITQYYWHNLYGLFYFVLIIVFFTLLFASLNAVGVLLAGIISVLTILAFMVYLYTVKNAYIPFSFVVLLIIFQTISNIAYLFSVEKKQKRKLNQLFGQYVPEEYVKELVDFPEQSSMEGQVRHMTVFFSDIRNFTAISEPLEATEVKRLLNTFFTPITEIIFSFRGTIDKYVGDMIVAFWGAPIQDEEHVSHAIMAALAVVKKLPEINEKMMEQNLPPVTIGIGLATGLMNVGDMGSEFRRAYTVLGDTVNLGSRLQDLTKFYHVNILVSDATREGQNQIVWRPIDRITVLGRKNSLMIYQPLGLNTEISKEMMMELDQYQQALDSFYARDWTAAEERFTALQRKSPDTYLYQLYLERIAAFKENPPDKNWDGTYTHLHK